MRFNVWASSLSKVNLSDLTRRGFALAALLGLFCLGRPSVAIAEEVSLRPGPGAALTSNKCVICHELKHITRSQLSRDEWQDNLAVMRARGLPITAEEYQIILTYLSTYYGREAPPPSMAEPIAPPSSAPLNANALLTQNGCMGCHALDKKLVGPGFNQVARRYQGQANALAILKKKIREGGQGSWGNVSMPAQAQLSERELETLVRFILDPATKPQ